MSDDTFTPTPRAAELHARHHGVAPLPADHGIRAEDVDFRMAGDHECGDDCWPCVLLPQARASLVAEARRRG